MSAVPAGHPAASPQQSPRIAIVGNPNAGKTTVFNGLTGSTQRVGNYPGVTVEKVTGSLRMDGRTIEVLDVPGMYSLIPVSEDERVAADALRGLDGHAPDLVVCVVDASNLERNLFLYSQIAEAGHAVLVALTMTDRLDESGRALDLIKLSNLLGAEVVPLVAHKNRGFDRLKEAIARNLEQPRCPRFDIGLPDALETRVAGLREQMARLGMDYPKSEIRRALLQPHEQLERMLGAFPELQGAFESARLELESQGVSEPSLDSTTRYRWTAMVQRAAVGEPTSPGTRTLSDRIDGVLTHRIFGLAVFAGIMMLVFQSIYTFAKPLMDSIDWVFSRVGDWLGARLDSVPVLQSLVVKGIIGGIGSVMVFLPQILILFFFISLLEGTGYLARAAFLMDRLLSWCGLNGRAFIPLLSSFACAIPGIMAARVMPDPKARLATILVAPLMSCSARLPVYILLIGAFIQPRFGPIWAGFALFAMHLLGLVVAIPVVWILNRRMFKARKLPFLLELPPYQWPRWRDVWLTMYVRARVFLKTAGTVIVAMSIVIWFLSSFPKLGEPERNSLRADTVARLGSVDQAAIDQRIAEAELEGSYLGRFGKTIEPAFVPAGFDWRITTSILAAFPAREVVVPSMGIIFSLGDNVDQQSHDLRKALRAATWPDGRPLMTTWTAVGLMVFFALCCQCMSTLATIRRETNSWKWPVFTFTYMTALAYLFAVGIHQLGRALGT